MGLEPTISSWTADMRLTAEFKEEKKEVTHLHMMALSFPGGIVKIYNGLCLLLNG